MDGHDPRDLAVDDFFAAPISLTAPRLAGVIGRELVASARRSS